MGVRCIVVCSLLLYFCVFWIVLSCSLFFVLLFLVVQFA